MPNQLLIIVAIIGMIELILVFVFWFTHLRHYKKHPIYRIRHPIFWMVCLCFACIITISRAIGIYLYLNHYISLNAVLQQQSFSILLFGINFPMAR